MRVKGLPGDYLASLIRRRRRIMELWNVGISGCSAKMFVCARVRPAAAKLVRAKTGLWLIYIQKSIQTVKQGKQQATDFGGHFIKLHTQGQCFSPVMDNLTVPGDLTGDFQQQRGGDNADVYSVI
jgi:hypothetical protein